MGMRIPQSLNPSGLDTQKIIEGLMQVEKQPIEANKKRREKIVEEKGEVQKLQTIMSELDASLKALKTKQDFYKLKVDSSHPDIMDGVVDTYALPGTYEFEVRGVAKTEKELAYGFPDKDETPVGFGFMLVEREDGEPMDVTIEPNSTLQQVANQINDSEAGVRAMVINTKYKPDSFRLLVISEKSGKEAKIMIDEDTTFLEFKEQVSGRNLDILFEDVPVQDEDNVLEELVEGVTFQVKRSEPGTRVQMSINHDIDATLEGIASFVEKYNQTAEFIHSQFIVDPKTNRAGILSGDSGIRMILRHLQGALGAPGGSGKYRTLADIGITTNPKNGSLNFDDTKVRAALAEDYDGVASLFIETRSGQGAAQRLGERLKGFRDPGTGIIKSKLRGLDKVIKNQDETIERQERMLGSKEETLKRRFGALEGIMAEASSQRQFLSARFGGGNKQ